MYLLREGTVRCDLGDGRPPLALGPGEYFGERALLKDEPRAATITAESEVRAMAVGGCRECV
jgi:CRP-like cAMP-binding protein